MSYHLRVLLPARVAPGTAVTARATRAYAAALRVADERATRLLGFDDLAQDVAASVTALPAQSDHRKVRVIAIAGPDPRGTARRLATMSSVVPGTSVGAEEAPDGELPDVEDASEVLGAIFLAAPIDDPRATAQVAGGVREEAHGTGMADELFDLAERTAGSWGRSRLMTWSQHSTDRLVDIEGAPAGTGEDRGEGARGVASAAGLRPFDRFVAAASGWGSLRADVATDFLERRGWRLDQCEVHSVLDLDLDGAAGRAAPAVSPADRRYRIHAWTGPTPPAWREDAARLRRRMSVGVPSGIVRLVEQSWDAARIEREEQLLRARGTGLVQIVCASTRGTQSRICPRAASRTSSASAAGRSTGSGGSRCVLRGRAPSRNRPTAYALRVSFHLRQLLPPVVADVDGAPARVTAFPSRTLAAGLHLAEAHEAALLGNRDLAYVPQAVLNSFADPRDYGKAWFVAVAGPDPRVASARPDADDHPDAYGHVAAAMTDNSGALGRPTVSSVAPGADGSAAEVPPADLPDVSDEAEVLGFLTVDLPLRDNTDQAFVNISVRTGQRRTGIGQALTDVAEALARDDARTVLQGYTSHQPLVDDDGAAIPADALPAGAPVLRPTTGSGYVPRDGSTDFLVARGWVLEQVEAHSVLDVPEALAGADALETEARAGYAGDYEILTWAGPTPAEHRGGIAALYRRMSVDIPHGGLDWEEEDWDEDRVARLEQRIVDAGSALFTAAARHVATGELVAFTVLKGAPGRESVNQDETLVHGEHRGHRLGLAVKVANLRNLAERAPERVRVHTWNADENAHMLDINHHMGFRPKLVEGLWQKRLDG